MGRYHFMKNKKWYEIFLYTIACILIDIIGRTIADKFSLPFWFDSVGTVLMAYAAGPVCGAIVGLANNLIYGVFVDLQYIYSLVGILIGVIVGIASKKKIFEVPFKVVTLGMVLSLICTALSMPLNIILNDGIIGNVWGDQLSRMLQSYGLHRILAGTIGQFYIEFLDKLICVLIVLIVIRGVRFFREKLANKEDKKKDDKKKAKAADTAKKAVSVILVCILAGSLFVPSLKALAVDDENNYNQYTKIVYGKEQGLSVGEANDIEQTKDGKIWIGTYAGLYSYDGSKFKLYNDIDTVKNVNCFYVDEEGRLWIGTNDDGFSIMINGRVTNTMSEEHGLPSDIVKSITCDSNGNYYIGTSEGISVVSLSSGVKIKKNINDIKNVMRLAADGKGNVVAVTDEGNAYLLREGAIVKNAFTTAENYSFCSVHYMEDGTLIFGTTDNKVVTFKVSGNGYKRDHIYSCEGLRHINEFYETGDDLLVCSDSGAGYFNAKKEFIPINTNNFTSSIDSVIVDYQGDVWFASSRQGLLKLCKSPFTEIYKQLDIEENVTNAITRWDGLLVCGTDEGILFIDEEANTTIENEVSEILGGARIRDVFADSQDNLWVSTTGMGVYCVAKGDEEELVVTNYSEENGMPGARFRCILQLEDGSIAVSGDQGVAIIKDGEVVDTITAEDGLENIKSLCLLEYVGILFIGSDGGGISMYQNGTVTGHITREDGLSSNIVMRMVADPSGDGFFVVAGSGLNYIDSEGRVTALDKFPYSDNFNVIIDDNDNAWVLCSAGIYVATSDELKANKEVDYDLINLKRGLRPAMVSNSYSYLEDGILYICTESGAVKVAMTDYENNIKSYRMILNSINVDGVYYDIDRSASATIPSNAKKIVIEPEILNYSLNDPYISYRLMGFENTDKVMLLSELDSVTYSNLKPGTYTFKISVLDGKKNKVLETGRYNINIEHEMYENWWFKLYVVLVTGLIVAWITWFITRLQIQRVILKQELALEYAQLQLRMGKETILSIARAVDAKDSNTSQHSFRVSEYSVAIARRFGMNEERCENLRQMALLHDIGKIGIPDDILNKPGKLEPAQYEIMKTHVIRGGEILKDFSLIENVNIGALYHHEKYDGTGYCSGLRGEEIPLEARIIGIADAFDAMTANRVYRKQLDLDFVIAELTRCSGTQFDPVLVKIMIGLIEDGTINVAELYGKSQQQVDETLARYRDTVKGE